MQAEAQAFKATGIDAIEKAQSFEPAYGSLAIPAVSNVRTRCKTFAQTAKYTAVALIAIVRLFYDDMKKKNSLAGSAANRGGDPADLNIRSG